jgi:hypothetical protein
MVFLRKLLTAQPDRKPADPARCSGRILGIASAIDWPRRAEMKNAGAWPAF